MRPRSIATAAMVAFALGCTAGGGDGVAHGALADDGRLSFWLPDFRTLPAASDWIVPLADHHTEVIVEVEDGADPLDELAALVRELDRAGVRVELWPALSATDGDWVSVRNVDRFAEYVERLLRFVEDERLPIDTLTIDMEPLPEKSARLFRSPVAGAAAILADYDPVLYRHGQEAFAELVDGLHRRGYFVHVSIPNPFEVDLADGDQDLHRLLDLVVGGVAWDDVSYQLYGSALGFGADYVYRSALALRDALGSCAGVDLENGPAVQDDLAAALAAGIPLERIHLFPYQQVLAGPLGVDWFSRPAPPFAVPARDRGVDLYRGALALADRATDALNITATAPDRPLSCAP